MSLMREFFFELRSQFTSSPIDTVTPLLRVYEGKDSDLIRTTAVVTQYVPCKHCRAYIKPNAL